MVRLEMKIHFCDICNESVPQTDLGAGKAYVRKGRVVCATCDNAMSRFEAESRGDKAAAQEAAPAEAASPEVEAARTELTARSGAGSLVAVTVASLAILVTVAAATILAERIRNVEQGAIRSMGDVRSDMEYRANLLESDLRSARDEDQANLEFVQEELLGLRSEVRDESLARQASVAAVRAEFDAALTRFGELDAVVKAATRNGSELDSVNRTLLAFSGDLQNVAERIAELEVGGILVTPEMDLIASGPPAWTGLVDELTSDNAGSRWSAVQALGETGDVQVVPHLIPMLTDADIFVRMATARILGDLRAMQAIPALIQALNDGEASVREASVVTLRALSGRNFRFDPSASVSERQRRIQAWEAWWSENESDLLGKSA